MRKVMIVEDEELILQGIRNIVDWEALKLQPVHMAYSGEEALRLWEKEPVDIIITDIEMAGMSGLDLLREIRKKDAFVRFLILTGYDEFAYAREAIRLEVEYYILKPIDEEELERQLRAASAKLDELEKEKISYIDEKNEWLQFLSGKVPQEASGALLRQLHLEEASAPFFAAVMKWSADSVKEKRLADMLLELRKEAQGLRIVHLPPDSLLLVTADCGTPAQGREYFQKLQDKIENDYSILTFVSIGPPVEDLNRLPESYRQAMKMQKYLLVDGYGSCVDETYIQSRKSEDIAIDRTELRRLILKKEKEGAVGYLEDLFINNVRSDMSLDSLYQMAVQIAMLLQEIKKEYKLDDYGNLHNLPELIDTIYQAEDLFGIKTLFISEVNEIIRYLHEENSQYTPVVRQILEEVHRNYTEDMNLKTLAYKYHMNASYLGQIFQKEVGCSFTQYLTSRKIEMAKEMILNTNLKISDIARQVGYPDTSYFYRKFKQHYGVAPVSLREMKKY